jgi:predicted nucleic acid-binding protein
MIFLDTSAIYALADRNDFHHKKAKRIFEELLLAKEEFLMHNYILIESIALIQHRLGFTPAKRFLEETNQFQIVWADTHIHIKALAYFNRYGRRKLSFVDCVSFAVMKEHGAKNVFAFDEDFTREDFMLAS